MNADSYPINNNNKIEYVDEEPLEAIKTTTVKTTIDKRTTEKTITENPVLEIIKECCKYAKTNIHDLIQTPVQDWTLYQTSVVILAILIIVGLMKWKSAHKIRMERIYIRQMNVKTP